MAIKITIRDSRNPEEVFVRTFTQERIAIGRSRTCQVCLPDLAVSSIHMQIILKGNNYTAIDQGSVNGTVVDGKKLIAHRPKPLSNNAELQVAHFQLTFNLGVAPQGNLDQNISQSQARQMLATSLAENPPDTPPVLIILKGPGRAARFELPPAPCELMIGKGRQCDISIDDKDVGRQHARLLYGDEGLTINSVHDRFELFVNGEPSVSSLLTNGDTFRVGNTELGLENPLEPALYAIQKAPEDDTSSFFPGSPLAPLEAPAPKKSATEEQPGDEIAPLPTGPEDPLLAKETADYVKTQEIPILPEDQKSDMGLIVVGAIIVIGCVVGLYWLLT